MPLYPFVCPSCGSRVEVLCKVSEKPSSLDCDCGDVARQQVSRVARTRGSWGGVDTGYFDRGLGQWVDSSREADKIAKERGLVRATEFDKDFIEDSLEDFGNEQRQLEKDSQEYQSKVAAGMDKAEAAADVFSVSKLQQRGMLDTSIKGD